MKTHINYAVKLEILEETVDEHGMIVDRHSIASTVTSFDTRQEAKDKYFEAQKAIGYY